MASPSARFQGATVVAITATILGAGWLLADGPGESPSATFYEPFRVPLVDVLVGKDEEDRGK